MRPGRCAAGRRQILQGRRAGSAVFHTEEGYFATCDICTHEHEHLAEGWLEADKIECPRHGAQFDLRTGEALSLPATEPLETFPVQLEGEDVNVLIPVRYLLPAEPGK